MERLPRRTVGAAPKGADVEPFRPPYPKLAPADERAIQLLRRHLTPEQLRIFDRLGSFGLSRGNFHCYLHYYLDEVEKPKKSRRNIFGRKNKEDDTPTARLHASFGGICISARDPNVKEIPFNRIPLPAADQLLAFKLAVESDGEGEYSPYAFQDEARYWEFHHC